MEVDLTKLYIVFRHILNSSLNHDESKKFYAVNYIKAVFLYIDPLFYTTFQIMRVIYNYTCILISPRKNFKFVGRAIKNPLCIFFIKSLNLSLRYVCGCFWNKIVSNKKKFE